MAFAAARQMPARRTPTDMRESDGSSGAVIVLRLLKDSFPNAEHAAPWSACTSRLGRRDPSRCEKLCGRFSSSSLRMTARGGLIEESCCCLLLFCCPGAVGVQFSAIPVQFSKKNCTTKAPVLSMVFDRLVQLVQFFSTYFIIYK